MFYLSSTCGMIFILKTTLKWPALMRLWVAAETKLPTFRNQKQRRNFILKLRSLVFAMLFMALGCKHFNFYQIIFLIWF